MGDMDQPDSGADLTLFWALAVTRWIHFASCFVLFGSAFFWFYVQGPFPRARRATEILLRLAALAAAVSGLAWLAEIIANMADGIGKVFEAETLRLFFTRTIFGPVAAMRLLLLAVALALAALTGRSRVWLSCVLLVGALLLIDQAWLGHAGEGSGTRAVAMISAYCIHVLAAATWAAGLPPLFFALRELRGQKSEADLHVRRAMLTRFSAVGIIAVGLVVVTGALNAGFRTGLLAENANWSGSWGGYGPVLIVKASLVAAMLVLAGYNRFIAMPRLRVSRDDDAAQALWLRRSVETEAFLGALVLAAAAVLGMTPPPN
jgi:putative copper resistance protein D